jgi:hypothetical protein
LNSVKSAKKEKVTQAEDEGREDNDGRGEEEEKIGGRRKWRRTGEGGE